MTPESYERASRLKHEIDTTEEQLLLLKNVLVRTDYNLGIINETSRSCYNDFCKLHLSKDNEEKIINSIVAILTEKLINLKQQFKELT